MAGLGAGLIGYLGAEVVLSSLPHPIHWVTALVIGILAAFAGWFWNFWQRRV